MILLNNGSVTFLTWLHPINVIVGVLVKQCALDTKCEPGNTMPDKKKLFSKDLAIVLKKTIDQAGSVPSGEPRAGQLCLVCGKGIVEYDGMLNLTCANCGTSRSGCFT